MPENGRYCYRDTIYELNIFIPEVETTIKVTLHSSNLLVTQTDSLKNEKKFH